MTTVQNLADALGTTYGGSADERRAYARGFMAYHALHLEAQRNGGGIADLFPVYEQPAGAQAASTKITPAIQTCPICDHGYDGSEIPISVVAEAGLDPCPKCKEYMKAGIVCVETDARGTARTGRACVLRDETVRKLMEAAPSIRHLTEKVIAARIAYLPGKMYDEWVGAYYNGDEDERRR